jgi:hypothetical protein
MSERNTNPGPSRRREIIEHLPGGYLIDFDGSRSIETAETIAGLIQRRWPEVAHHFWELESIARWLERLAAELDKCTTRAQVDALAARDSVVAMQQRAGDGIAALLEAAYAKVGPAEAIEPPAPPPAPAKPNKTKRIVFVREPQAFVAGLATWSPENRDAICITDEFRDWLKELSEEDYKYVQQALGDHVQWHKAKVVEGTPP